MFVEVGAKPGEMTAVTGGGQITQVEIVLLEMLECAGQRRGEKNKMALKPAMWRTGLITETSFAGPLPEPGSLLLLQQL